VTFGNDCQFLKIGSRYVNMDHICAIARGVTNDPQAGYTLCYIHDAGYVEVVTAEEVRQLEAFLAEHAATY
jgi:hypothetical protein